MRLTVKAPFDFDRHAEVSVPAGQTLGALCAPHQAQVTGCLINGMFHPDWQTYEPQNADEITLFCRTEAVALGIAAAGSIYATIINAVIVAVVTTALSIALQAGIKALSSESARANSAGKTEQIFGIAGLTNTTALGTPKFLVYGTRRVFGHIINTRVSISPDGKTTSFGILYFMGEGPIAGMSALEINDTPLAQFPGVESFVRLGDGNAVPIPGFDTISSVWSDGRQLALATPIVYTTRGSTVERATLILSTPFLFSQAASGDHGPATHTLHIEYAPLSSGVYVDADVSPLAWTDTTESPRFLPVVLQFDHADSWLIRVTLDATDNTQDTPPALYNVQEESTGAQLYETSALLAFTGIASGQIGSFEGMRGSALVQGRVVTIWDGDDYTEAWSDNRAWVLRDLMTNTRVGLGHRIPASLFDDDAALVAADYWDELAEGIRRDRCDLLLNDRRAAWDWLKVVLTEGRAILIPSGGLFKIVVDKAASPQLLYSSPGNILEGTVTQTFGDGQGVLPNTIRGQFPDEAANDRLQVVEVSAPDIGSEPVRETLVTIYTLTSLARVFWLLRYQLLRARLVQRHFTWQSPTTALVSEPLDQVSLAYETPDFARGVSGFCPGGEIGGRLLLDRLVTLAPSTTYALIVRHQADNTVERLTVATGAGTWGAIEPTVPFDSVPVEGDLWAIGVTTTAILPVVIESVQLQEGGTYALTAAVYEPSVHETPAPPTVLGPGPTMDRRPLPLWAVSVTEIVQTGTDGGTQLFLSFQVTPQLQTHGGAVRAPGPEGSNPAYVHLQADEPLPTAPGARLVGTLDGYYTGATLTITSGTGTGQVQPMVDYISSGYISLVETDLQYAIVDPPFDVTPDATSTYTIDWPLFNETTGFVVEESIPDVSTVPGPWTVLNTWSGLSGLVAAPTDGLERAYRFAPLAGTVRNLTARWIVIYTVQGDVTAPAAPTDSGGDGGTC